ncbi:MAG: DHHW family protein [Eubacteriales bacterium]
MHKRLKLIAIVLFLLPFFALGLLSVLDSDEVLSMEENRNLAQKVSPTFQTLVNSEFTADYEVYYQDQFPYRTELIACNQMINFLYSLNIPSNLVSFFSGILYQKDTPKDEIIPPVISPEMEEQPSELPPVEEPVPEPEPDLTWYGNSDFFIPYAEDIAYIDSFNYITSNSSIELYEYTPERLAQYAHILNAYGDALPEVDTYFMFVPNSAEFYLPNSIQNSLDSQEDGFVYMSSLLSDQIGTIDLFPVFSAHLEEYIFFRTDHHWTTRGAYYACEAFLEATGVTALLPDDYTYGYREDFLGSLHSVSTMFTNSLENYPDVVEYFIPNMPSTATLYHTAEMTDGTEIDLVQPDYNLEDSLYHVFLGGDAAILDIQTEVGNGKTLVLVRDSYGHAILPHLLPYYDRIIAVEPRYFNTEGFPSLNLIDFVEKVEADDLLFLSYSIPLSGFYWWMDWCQVVEGMHPNWGA